MALEITLSTQLRWEKFPMVAAHALARKQLVIEEALGLSPNTLEAYGRAREDFLAFCKAYGVEPVLANKETLALWVRDMLRRPSVVKFDEGGSGSRLPQSLLDKFCETCTYSVKGTDPRRPAPVL